jgi:hypothetical protein
MNNKTELSNKEKKTKIIETEENENRRGGGMKRKIFYVAGQRGRQTHVVW